MLPMPIYYLHANGLILGHLKKTSGTEQQAVE